MIDRRNLPAAQAVLTDPEGRATPPFYDFLRRIVGEFTDLANLLAQLQALIDQLETELPDLSAYTKRAANELISGQWDFQKPLRTQFGTAEFPSFTFTNDIHSGIFHQIDTNAIAISIDEVQHFEIDASRILFDLPMYGGDGTAAAPTYTFSADADIGLYRVGANNMGIATGGVLHWDINTARVAQDIPLIVTNLDGVFVQNPSYPGAGCQITTFGSDPSSGIGSEIAFWEHFPREFGFRIRQEGDTFATGDLVFYRHSNDAIGVPVLRFTRTADQAQFADGTAPSPSISFMGDLNTGIYHSNPDEVSIATAGGQRLFVTTANIIGNVPFMAPTSANAGAPGFTFSSDGDTGMYRIGANNLGFSTGGTLRLDISNTRIEPAIPIYAQNGSNASPPYTFLNDPNTGIYSGGVNILAFSTDGAMRLGLGAAGEILDGSGSPGVVGQVPVSAGAGFPWVWDDQSGGGGASLAYVNTSVPAGNTVANTGAETTFSSTYTIPAGQLQTGSTIRVKLFGVFGTDAVAPTLRLRVKLAGTTILDTTATTLTGALTNQGWLFESQSIVFTDGASGTLDSQGFAEFATSAADGQVINTENTSTSSIDTTATLALTVTVQWGTADTDNTITLREMAVELMDAVSPTGAAAADATYLTEDDETARLPNSRQLLAGTSIAFDDSVAGQLTISSTGAAASLPNKEWRAINGATPQGLGATDPVAVGTGATPAKVTGGGYVGYTGKRRATSTTAANNVASYRSSVDEDGCYAAVSGSASAAGFIFSMHFGTPVVVAGERFFAGLALNAAEAGTVDPSSLLNCFGVGKDGSDTNYQIMHNDGSGTATKVNTGLAFAANKFFQLDINVPAGGGNWDYELTDLDTGTVYSGSISTNVPGSNISLNWRLWASVGTTAGTAVAVDFGRAALRYPLA